MIDAPDKSDITQAAAALGRKGGLSRSKAKIKAVKKNGSKGGAPIVWYVIDRGGGKIECVKTTGRGVQLTLGKARRGGTLARAWKLAEEVKDRRLFGEEVFATAVPEVRSWIIKELILLGLKL